MGMVIDQCGNVYVVGYYFNNIYQVFLEGGFIQIIVLEDDGFKKLIMMIFNGEKIFLSYESYIIIYMYFFQGNLFFFFKKMVFKF